MPAFFGIELFKKYPTRALVLEFRGTKLRPILDWVARVKRPDGTEVMEFKNIKDAGGKADIFPAPTGDYYLQLSKGGSFLILLSPKSSVYIPAQPDMFIIKKENGNKLAVKAKEIGLALHLADSKIDEWRALEDQRVMEFTKPDVPWWQANFPMIALMITAGILAFVMIFAFGPIEHLAASLSQVSANILEAVKVQAQSAGTLLPKTV